MDSIREDIDTIDKSVNVIKQLSENGVTDRNQLVRWIIDKEEHADKIQDIVSQYFLTQRIKPVKADEEGYERYIKQLKILHEIIIYSMKAKQSLDMENVEILKKKLSEFEILFFKDQM